MKFRNQTRLCLAIYHFEAHIMLSLFFQGTGQPAWEKFNSNAAVKRISFFSHFYSFIIFNLL